MYEQKIILVDDNDIRIDRYIRNKIFCGIKQSLIERYLRKGVILLDNVKVKSNIRVFAGQKIYIKDQILYSIKNTNNTKFHDDAFITLIKKSILYEDHNILAINKPYGISVQGGSKIRISISDILDQIELGKKFKIVHRLDKHTSGVLLLAKNRNVANIIMNEFKNQNVKKEYIALTAGIPKNASGEINLDILEKKSVTLFDVIKKFDNHNIALLKIMPLTGRKHQIRMHLSSIDCPIIGDRRYGKERSNLQEQNNRLQLHAYKISIKLENNFLTFTAPIPYAITKMINHLNKSFLEAQ